MSNVNLEKFEFSILRILDCGFSVEEAIVAEDGKITLGYGLNLTVDISDNSVLFLIRCQFNHVEHKLPMVTSTVLTKFSVNNLEKYLNDEKKFVFPKNSLETLFGISFSHLRAITSKNLGGSSQVILYIPIINSYDLFNGLLSDNIRLMKDNPDLYSPEEIETMAMFYQPEPSKNLIAD